MNIAPRRRTLRATTCAALAFLLGACAAATRPAGPERPRANEPPYPVVLSSSDERRAGALANWVSLVGGQPAAAAPTPEFQPVTATLAALPANLSTPPRLPKVIIEDENTQSEEETRESLRRFLATSAPLLGVNLQELSLVEIADAPGGAKRARYRQSPFTYPLRNGFGVVEVSFMPDLRVVGLSSTAIPDAERLRRALSTVAPKLTAAQAVAALANRAVTFDDRNGTRQTRTVTQADAVAARELVIFPSRASGDADTLELHLAWEVAVGGPEAPLLVYVDAVTGEPIAATPGS
jgi:hypothetical protein